MWKRVNVFKKKKKAVDYIHAELKVSVLTNGIYVH